MSSRLFPQHGNQAQSLRHNTASERSAVGQLLSESGQHTLCCSMMLIWVLSTTHQLPSTRHSCELHDQPREACTGASVSNGSESHTSLCSNAWVVFDLEEKFTVTKIRSLVARTT